MWNGLTHRSLSTKKTLSCAFYFYCHPFVVDVLQPGQEGPAVEARPNVSGLFIGRRRRRRVVVDILVQQDRTSTVR